MRTGMNSGCHGTTSKDLAQPALVESIRCLVMRFQRAHPRPNDPRLCCSGLIAMTAPTSSGETCIRSGCFWTAQIWRHMHGRMPARSCEPAPHSGLTAKTAPASTGSIRHARSLILGIPSLEPRLYSSSANTIEWPHSQRIRRPEVINDPLRLWANGRR